jgi:hypothetical protein
VPDPTSDALAAIVANLDAACRQVDEACRQAQETSAQIKAEMLSQGRFTEPVPDRPAQRRKVKPKARKRKATKKRPRGNSRRSTTNGVGHELSAGFEPLKKIPFLLFAMPKVKRRGGDYPQRRRPEMTRTQSSWNRKKSSNRCL